MCTRQYEKQVVNNSATYREWVFFRNLFLLLIRPSLQCIHPELNIAEYQRNSLSFELPDIFLVWEFKMISDLFVAAPIRKYRGIYQTEHSQTVPLFDK